MKSRIAIIISLLCMVSMLAIAQTRNKKHAAKRPAASAKQTAPSVTGYAAKWLEKAKAGDAEAQVQLANCYYRGDLGTKLDYGKALEWAKKASDQGNPWGTWLVGVIYGEGYGVVERNEAAARQWHKKAKEQASKLELERDACSLYTLGVMYTYGDGGLEKNATRAFAYYMRAARLGFAPAQIHLGAAYKNGNGVSQDYVEAEKWYMKAALQEDPIAQYSIGIIYDYGYGVTKNQSEAVKWYRKAAEQGYASAQYDLGCCYDSGEGVTKNPAEAVKWWRKAAEQGDWKAQHNLGNSYYNGYGVTKNLSEAVRWYRKAAEQGDCDAQWNLYVYYSNGEGVAKNMTIANQWLRKAADNGHSKAKEIIEEQASNANALQLKRQFIKKWGATYASYFFGSDDNVTLRLNIVQGMTVGMIQDFIRIANDNGYRPGFYRWELKSYYPNNWDIQVFGANCRRMEVVDRSGSLCKRFWTRNGTVIGVKGD